MNLSPERLRRIEELVGSQDQPLADGGYAGAARFDKQIAGWNPVLRSADAEIIPQKDRLDARTLDLARNDSFVQSVGNIHKDSIVGAFYMLNAKPAHKTLGLDETWAEEFQEEVEELFTLWSESPMRWVDATRQNDFTSLVRLVVAISTFHGESLATAEWVRDDRREFRTAIQLVDTARLETPSTLNYDANVRGGVRFNNAGVPVSYYIRVNHPHDLVWHVPNNGGEVFKEVAVEKPWGRRMVLHNREMQRVDETRAVADLTSGLREIAMMRKFRDVTLQKAVLAATYAATIESELPDHVVYQQLGAQMTGTPSTAIVDYGADFLAALNAYVGSAKNIGIDGVKIPHLFPGTKLNMVSVGDPAGVGREFEESLLRHLAAAGNVSYEEVSRDYTNTNYATIKAAVAQTFRYMQGRKRATADAFATQVYRLWLEEAVNNDRISTFRAKDARKLYYRDMLSTGFDALSQCSWIGAGRTQIDELKETQAAVLRIKYGLSTHEDELARLGKDWRKVYAQLERETKEREERGITLLEDNSVNAASGSPRETRDDRPGEENTDDDTE